MELHVYADGDNGVAVEHYKVIGGDHTWPGNAYGGVGTNNDIDASVEIWNFFSKYDLNGLTNPVGIEDDNDIAVVNHRLNNYPNPFNPTTIISFSIAQNEQYELIIYNVKGQVVKTFSNHPITQSAEQQVTWNGTDDSGKPVSSGIYFCRLKAGEFRAAKKMLLLK